MSDDKNLDLALRPIIAEMAAQRAALTYMAGVLHSAGDLDLEEMARDIEELKLAPDVRECLRSLAGELRLARDQIAAGRSPKAAHLSVIEGEDSPA